MPYIQQKDREKFAIPVPENGGELQYLIAEMIQNMLQFRRLSGDNSCIRYKDLEEVMGALNGANQEFYRLVVAPYEDRKSVENGNVYDTYGWFTDSY